MQNYNMHCVGCSITTISSNRVDFNTVREEDKMKKIELFQCEICGTQFKEKADCVKCEKNHESWKDLRITNARFLPFTQDASGMPITITLMGKNGNTYRYRR